MIKRRRSHAAAFVLAVALAGCASRRDAPVPASLSEDDDAYCRRTAGVAGSSEYVACRKDRDVARSNATSRADRAQRNLGETMLNNPENGMRR